MHAALRGDTDYLPFKSHVRPPAEARPGATYTRDRATLRCGDARAFYADWPAPVCIVSDGAYGVGGFKGDPRSADKLPAWYAPHLKAWTARATPLTTLWFWCTEEGWATMHTPIVEQGWRFKGCHVWNKGIGHIAGNVNSKTIRGFPVVTEVCVRYTRDDAYDLGAAAGESLQAWLRKEWLRTGLPLSRTNAACGVKDAATRKYFTQAPEWYPPPEATMARLAAYANEHGAPEGKPYFELDGQRVSDRAWTLHRARWNHVHGLTNVWDEPAVRGAERFQGRSHHTNQKPRALIDRLVNASTDAGDVLWEPFAGLATATVSAHHLQRVSFAAEIDMDGFLMAARRLSNYDGV